MTNKQFYTALKRIVVVHLVHMNTLSKSEEAKFEDAITFCNRQMSDEMHPDANAPKNRLQMMEQLLEGAGSNEQYTCRKWEAYAGGCGHIALTPDADAIRDHYFTAEQIERLNLSWNNYPPRVKNWQDYEARRLHAAADMLCELAFVLDLFNK